jgi:hypothetical protein
MRMPRRCRGSEAQFPVQLFVQWGFEGLQYGCEVRRRIKNSDKDRNSVNYSRAICMALRLPKETIAELNIFEIAHNPSVYDKASEVDDCQTNFEHD